jgi:hypothetical protein
MMMLDLQAIFGKGATPTTATVVQSVAVPEPIPGPKAAELPTLAVDTVWAAVVEVPDFNSLPMPGPACLVCGSLESWQDLLGRQRCGVCEADTLGKALKLAELAARLRQQAQQRETTPRITPGCVTVGRVDILDFDGNRPVQGQLQGFDGV